MQAGLVTVLLQPCIEVASHTPVAECIGTVGSDVNLDEPVALQVIVLGSRLTNRCILREHDDTVVRSTHTDFILSTDHTQTLYTTELALLDGKTLVAVIEHAAQVGNDYLLTGSYIRCTADNLLWLTLAQVNGCHVEVIAVRMRLACQYFTYIETFQSTLDRLYFFQSVHFESARGQRIGCLLWCQVEIDVFFKPFI